jgi:hypothetical protein
MFAKVHEKKKKTPPPPHTHTHTHTHTRQITEVSDSEMSEEQVVVFSKILSYSSQRGIEEYHHSVAMTGYTDISLGGRKR